MIVTCETEGCGNQGIPLEINATWMDVNDVERPVTAVQCGVCLEWIIAPDEE